ncbi:hypothetical protein CCM_06276 [Cordyceps militaris CM01]|uniref:Uncharacterized protein n=1 Tax=Cordyceps militaris (strain CM01) TaxID=983644 RepID=G3JJT2_CORMM|nr:uncharacterized protein CCM_06276 [Cordyceps militaris CM01]EGX92116.1 hypothetical protein CCM_06276 [Cordyceps militaris CM01]
MVKDCTKLFYSKNGDNDVDLQKYITVEDFSTWNREAERRLSRHQKEYLKGVNELLSFVSFSQDWRGVPEQVVIQ